MLTDQITDNEISEAVKILKKLDPGFLPEDLFIQFTRLTPTAILEIVPLRLNGGKVEVMFLTRPEEDPVWPGMLHTPGTVIRSTDVNIKTRGFDKAAARIFDKELNLNLDEFKKQTGRDLIFSETLLHYPLRGPEQANVFYVDLTNFDVGANGPLWLDPNNLPSNVVDTQIYFIQKAAESFKQYIQSTY